MSPHNMFPWRNTENMYLIPNHRPIYKGDNLYSVCFPSHLISSEKENKTKKKKKNLLLSGANNFHLIKVDPVSDGRQKQF